MGRHAELATSSGEPIAGYLAGSGTIKVILIHEIFGLNAQMRHVADRLAAEGFTVFAIDLFAGRTTDELEEGYALARALDCNLAARQIGDAAIALHGRDATAVGIVGFCLGGSLALVAAASIPFRACVCYYGIPQPDKVDLTRIRGKVLAHFGTRDVHISNDRVDALETLLADAGVRAQICRYDAGHGFVREEPDADPARISWARTVAFLREELADPIARS